MKRYITPNLDILGFTAQDIVTVSDQSTYIEDSIDAINAIDMAGLFG